MPRVAWPRSSRPGLDWCRQSTRQDPTMTQACCLWQACTSGGATARRPTTIRIDGCAAAPSSRPRPATTSARLSEVSSLRPRSSGYQPRQACKAHADRSWQRPRTGCADDVTDLRQSDVSRTVAGHLVGPPRQPTRDCRILCVPTVSSVGWTGTIWAASRLGCRWLACVWCFKRRHPGDRHCRSPRGSAGTIR
jgi:hypothetical protein